MMKANFLEQRGASLETEQAAETPVVESESEPEEEEAPVVISDMEQQFTMQEQVITSLRRQILSMATDVNKKHNEQQSQLQGVEAVSLFVFFTGCFRTVGRRNSNWIRRVYSYY